MEPVTDTIFTDASAIQKEIEQAGGIYIIAESINGFINNYYQQFGNYGSVE